MEERGIIFRVVFVVTFCLVLFKPGYNYGSARDSLRTTPGLKLFELEWDNDLFQQTDRYYTQGAHFIYVHPNIRYNPLRFIAWRPLNTENHYALSLHQEMYTPQDKDDTAKVVGDHPYAGLLYMRSTFVSSSFEKKLRLITEVDLGYTGQYTGGYTLQAYIHKITNGKHPNGWSNQIKPMPIVNYNLTVQKGIWNDEFFELITQVKARAGTLYSDFQAGGMFKIGLFDPWFTHWKRAEKFKEGRKIQAYYIGGLHGKYVLYNAVLQGSRSEYLNNEHFGYDDIVRRIALLNMGVGASWNFIGVNYMFQKSTPEFKGGFSHGWSRISVSIRL